MDLIELHKRYVHFSSYLLYAALSKNAVVCFFSFGGYSAYVCCTRADLIAIYLAVDFWCPCMRCMRLRPAIAGSLNPAAMLHVPYARWFGLYGVEFLLLLLSVYVCAV